MLCPATERAVSAVLAAGVPDLTRPAAYREVERSLRAAITVDLRDGATSSDITKALRRACSDDLSTYTSLLELLVLVIAEQRTSSPPATTTRPPGRLRRARRPGL